MSKLWRGVWLTAVLTLLAGCAPWASKPHFEYQLPSPNLNPPEGASGWTDKPGWRAQHWMAAAAHPLAVDAAVQILHAGGSAVDAAIAAEMVLNLVEPQSSGIGGGAFLVHWDGHEVEAYDGRETAPADVDEALFEDEGKAIDFYEGVVGGRSVGVPGLLRMLELAHQRHGKLPWADLFEPAIQLATLGFSISPRLAALIEDDAHLADDAEARLYFYEAGGRPKQAGMLLQNPELAATLKEVAMKGAEVFYTGSLAHEIALKVQGHPSNPGQLSEQDMSAYQAKVGPALCFNYRRYRLCGPPPPSSGPLTLGEILGVLESTAIASHRPQHNPDGSWSLPVEAVHLYSEAARLAYADRAYYAADGEQVPVPVSGLLDPGYLKGRSALIGEWSMGRADPGMPPGVVAEGGRDSSPELPSTSHISIVDGDGNAVSMTASIEDAFGSRQMVRGFLLNNQLTDFSFSPKDGSGRPVANRVQPGKRPRSSMTPLLVFDPDGRLIMSLGSPGGSAIINYVGKVVLGTLDWGLNVQEAIDLPNFGSRNGPTELEAGRVSDALVGGLESRGHQISQRPQTSGIQAIQRVDGGWFGGADPRREGVARGE